MKRIFFIFAVAMLCLKAFASDEPGENLQTAIIDGIEWTYVVLDEAAKTCKVGGKGGNSNLSGKAIDKNTTGAITIPDVINGYTVVEIHKKAFENCKKITSIVVSEHVRVIGESAFEDCKSLVTAELPASLISIGDEPFDKCENIAEVIIHATTPPEVDGNVLDFHHETGIPYSPNARLHVPAGCKAAYSAAEGWKNFLQCGGIVEDAETVTTTIVLSRVFPEKAIPSDVVRLKIVGIYDLSYSNQLRVALRNAKGDIEGQWDIDPGFDMKNIGSLDDLPDAVFDLQTAELGKYDIVVGDVVLENAFELEASDGGPNVTVEVNGRNEILLGRDNIYTIDFFNNSNVAAYNTPFTLFVSDKNGNMQLSFDFPIECYGEDIPQAVKDLCKDYEDGVVIDTQYGPMRGYMLNIPYIAPHGEAHYTFRIRQKEEDTTNQNLLMVYACGLSAGAYDPNQIESASTRGDNQGDNMDLNLVDCLIRYFSRGNTPPDLKCVLSIHRVIYAMKRNPHMPVANLAAMLRSAVMACTGNNSGDDPQIIIKKLWDDIIVVRVGCLVIIKKRNWVLVKNSCDPNEMIGPAGYDDEAHYIQPIRNMSYMITYENKSTATAPAHEVFINDQLDASAYDLSTFGFTAFGWAGKVWSVGGSKTKEFTRDISYTVNGTDIIVRVKGKFDEKTGEVNWSMVSLDKNGKEIDDPNIGYLVPNNDNGDGEGFVSFSIEHKANPANGSTVSNKATIVFDANKPIETNTYVNTFDTDYPTSKMTKAEQSGDNLVLSFEGSDATSGISSYNIYVFKDGGEAELLAADVRENSYSMPYDPKVNYAFCVIATDNVGWNEPKDLKPEMEYVTGISDINIDAKTLWTVYASDGRLVSVGEGAINLSLPGGVYVVRTGDMVRKVIIK